MRTIVRIGLVLLGGSVAAAIALAQPVSAQPKLLAASEPPSPGFVVPNDTWFGEQWYLFDWGQTIAGQIPTVPNIDIRAPEAWSITKGSPNVVVAVLDSGLIAGHHDFDGALWTNPGETGDGRETNGVDDDHDGYIDDVHGWDFQDNDNDPTDYTEGSQNEDFAHGTAVASAIAARGGDGYGVTGIAPGVQLMILRTNSITMDKAIDYAAAHGAQIANISQTSALPGEGMPQAATAIKANPKLLIVTGAGNGGYDVETFLNDPCHVPTDNVVCVAATDEHDQLAAFSVDGATSSFGNVSVDLGAPGTDIVAAVAARDNVFDIAKATPSDFTVNASSGVDWKVVGSQIQLSVSAGATGTSSIQLTTPIDISADRGCFVRYELTSTLPNGVQLSERRSLDGPYGGSPSGAFVAGAQPQTSYDDFVVSGIKKLGVGFGLALNAPATAAGTATIDNLTVACLAHESNPRAFGYTEGTSLSAPLTAGVAALVLSAHPSLTPGQVRQALVDGGAPDSYLVGKTVSGKRLDAYGALVAAAQLASGQAPAASAPAGSGAPVASAAGTSNGELVSKLLLPATPLKAPNHRVGAAPAVTKPTAKAAPAAPVKKAPVKKAAPPKPKHSKRYWELLAAVAGGTFIPFAWWVYWAKLHHSVTDAEAKTLLQKREQRVAKVHADYEASVRAHEEADAKRGPLKITVDTKAVFEGITNKFGGEAGQKVVGTAGDLKQFGGDLTGDAANWPQEKKDVYNQLRAKGYDDLTARQMINNSATGGLGADPFRDAAKDVLDAVTHGTLHDQIKGNEPPPSQSPQKPPPDIFDDLQGG